MSKRKQHGGARPHPPGREGGRPKNQHKTRQLKIQATDEEWANFLASLPSGTRDRYIYLVNLLEMVE